jgi:hypothetical protein
LAPRGPERNGAIELNRRRSTLGERGGERVEVGNGVHGIASARVVELKLKVILRGDE